MNTLLPYFLGNVLLKSVPNVCNALGRIYRIRYDSFNHRLLLYINIKQKLILTINKEMWMKKWRMRILHYMWAQKTNYVTTFWSLKIALFHVSCRAYWCYHNAISFVPTIRNNHGGRIFHYESNARLIHQSHCYFLHFRRLRLCLCLDCSAFLMNNFQIHVFHSIRPEMCYKMLSFIIHYWHII